MKININKDGITEVWLTGADVRRLERGAEVRNNDLIIYMEFYEDEYRTNQVPLKEL